MNADELQEKTDAFLLSRYVELTGETDRIAREIARRIAERGSTNLAERFGRVILKVKGVK